MNTAQNIASDGLVERELDENTFFALVKYARYILRFHYRGVIAEIESADLAPSFGCESSGD